MANPPAKIPSEVKDIAEAIAKGDVKNAKMEWKDDGTVSFSADSPDGKSRITMEKIEFSGVSQESKINISKPKSKEERLERVEHLYNQDKTQNEIAHYTMTSQKTVSNDLKELRKNGVIT